ncbi:hypothetical protein LCGC14_1483690, partial [marine sediment metagenome]
MENIKGKIDKLNGILIITSDHGNAEEMIDIKGNPKTSHTTNSVSFIIYDPNYVNKYELNKFEDPQLANI